MQPYKSHQHKVAGYYYLEQWFQSKSWDPHVSHVTSKRSLKFSKIKLHLKMAALSHIFRIIVTGSKTMIHK